MQLISQECFPKKETVSSNDCLIILSDVFLSLVKPLIVSF